MIDSIATIIQIGHLNGDPSHDVATRVYHFIEEERKKLEDAKERRDTVYTVLEESRQERE